MARNLRHRVASAIRKAGFRHEAMEDSLHFDIPVQSRVRPVRRARAPQRAAERPELLAAEPINLYHWAAVATGDCVDVRGHGLCCRHADAHAGRKRHECRVCRTQWRSCAWRHASRDAVAAFGASRATQYAGVRDGGANGNGTSDARPGGSFIRWFCRIRDQWH